MTDRAAQEAGFLQAAGWDQAEIASLAGDASNRRYKRLSMAGRRAVLMDAPPEKGEDVVPFVTIARHLRGIGLSAPEILAEDSGNGFLLLEDLGDDLYARVIPRAPDTEVALYTEATNALRLLHDATLPDVATYGPGLMTDMACLAFDKYRDAIAGAPDPEARRRFAERFEGILHDHVHGADVLVLRDYHAENLLWLPEREGAARVGLLDFQDAMIGHRAYDLVSLLQDARRDVPAGIEARMVAHYIQSAGVDDHGFRAAYAVLGVQRNLRILGVFGRLSLDYGKPHYVDLVPRVWDHMVRGLDHPALAPVADLLRDALPRPDAAALDRLRP